MIQINIQILHPFHIHITFVPYCFLCSNHVRDYSVVGQDYSATEYGEYDGQDYYEGGPVKQDYIGAVKDIDSDSIEEKESDEIFSSDYSGSASKVATEKDGKNNGDAMNKHLNIFDRV